MFFPSLQPTSSSPTVCAQARALLEQLSPTMARGFQNGLSVNGFLALGGQRCLRFFSCSRYFYCFQKGWAKRVQIIVQIVLG